MPDNVQRHYMRDSKGDCHDLSKGTVRPVGHSRFPLQFIIYLSIYSSVWFAQVRSPERPLMLRHCNSDPCMR